MSRKKRDKKASGWIETWLESREPPWFWHSQAVAAGQELGLRKSDVDKVLDRLEKTGRLYPRDRRGWIGIREDG